MEVPCIARELRVSEKSVHRWRRTWRTGGREALRSGGPSGYDCRLGPHLQAKLAMWLDDGPSAHGWADDQVWTAARVRTLIGRKVHISYSVSGVTRLLYRMGYSVQMPARPAAERDEDAITAWRETTWQEVKPSGRRPVRSSASMTRPPVDPQHHDEGHDPSLPQSGSASLSVGA
ncbi:winged helix-turn-helix domain-containing protein [Streptomyces hawaiiensis]|uniref:winged helix-turn-helix domain-containing protein n=1 Tax=Streptomyces hawaiiensis TaxID=67305 RepID=UPI003660FD94